MLRPDLSRPLTACDKGRFMRWSHVIYLTWLV